MLDLSGCRGLEELPEGVCSLTALRTLKLWGCEGLTTLPAGIVGLTALETLDLQELWLTELPPGLGALLAQRILNLHGCQGLTVTSLPDGLGALMGLQTLDLRKSRELTVLPEDLKALTGLKTLDLTWCDKLKEVPVWVMGLNGLRVPFEEWHLGVRGADGEEQIAVCVQPDKVDLTAHTSLVALPLALRTCAVSLRELVVASCVIEELPEWLGELENLEVLCVGGVVTSLNEGGLLEKGCPLGTLGLPDSLARLVALKTLRLEGCEKLTALPAGLQALTALQTIDLSYCGGLKRLPEGLESLEKLETLDLSYCSRLLEVPSEFGRLPVLKTVELYACRSLPTPPQYVILEGHASVMQFLCDLGKGFAPCYLVKVLLVGQQCAGKSSLTDLLMQGRPVTRALEDRTVGIDVGHCWLGADFDTIFGYAQIGKTDSNSCVLCDDKKIECHNGHQYTLSTNSISWFCDLCKRSFATKEGVDLTRLRCALCHCDLCEACATKSTCKDQLDQSANTSSNSSVDTHLENEKKLVVTFLDSAGHLVYSATHTLFMSSQVLVLHMIRIDMLEDDAVASVLEWVEADS